MKLRRVQAAPAALPAVQICSSNGWVDVATVLASITEPSSDHNGGHWTTDLVSLLAVPAPHRAAIEQTAANMPAAEPPATILIPFEPRSYRDFMLFERHAVDAARGFVRRFKPRLVPLISAYEMLTRHTFPALRPHSLWYRQPIYYMGNHLAFSTDGDAIAIPSYSRALDYELEVGFVLARGLFNASPEEAEAAIGGFAVFNDFSARDVQLDEMRSGFGPQKSKHFRSAVSSVVASADGIFPYWNSLRGFVKLNGKLVAETSVAEARWTLGEALAHVSRSERLYPGEFFGTGTLPGGSGIEAGRLLCAGDVIEIGIDRIGSLTNRIVEQESLRP